MAESNRQGLVNLINGTLAISEHPSPERNAWNYIAWVKCEMNKGACSTSKPSLPSFNLIMSQGMVRVGMRKTKTVEKRIEQQPGSRNNFQMQHRRRHNIAQ